MKLSFIVPIHNVERYLRKCVDSLLEQDFPSSAYEIILVDDESPDACPQICDEYAAAHDNIRVIHRKNGGLSAARNSGIEIAQGEYLSFVDSDDYWQPNVLGGLMAQVERDKLDVLRFKHQFVRIKNRGLEDERVSGLAEKYEVFNPYKSDPYKGNDYSTEPTDGISFLNTRLGTGCYAWAFIVKRSLIEGASSLSTFDSPLSPVLFTEGIYFEDTDWTPRMLVKAQRVASTDTVVYNYLMREGSITNAINRDKQRKVLDDKMRLIGALQEQAQTLHEQGHNDAWFGRMIAATVVSIISILSTQFYAERKEYLSRLYRMDIWPFYTGNHQSPITNLKTWLINLSPRLAVKLLHYKNRK